VTRVAAACGVFLLLPALALAQGGPPMVTDDPGTVPDKHWEINISELSSTAGGTSVVLFPYIDANYGWGERTQLKLETGWVLERSNVGNFRNGADTLLAGVKYRFLDEDKSGFAMSTYPQFQFHHFFSSTDPDLTVPGNEYLLPFEFSKTMGNWAVNPEVGYLYGTSFGSELIYGTVFGFEGAKPLEPLFEVHGESDLNGKGTSTLLNFGMRWTLNPHLNLIGAFGRTVTQNPETPLSWLTYFGLQLEL
jgi:hypothetical protein